ncbi:L-aminoadipate-semialdehyde dehydrogenase-phosphopantetheinyl transferase [Halotydeus destructor]|nr:L-aminoadipate-semialdehyde dehydrogenase-phosphopantetheinyl transferase [Halotydeus destructor]
MTIPSIRWAFNVRDWSPSREQFLFCLRCLQPQERARVLSFVYKKDVKPALIGRLLLRKCATKLLKLPYSSIKFNRTDKGKPVIDWSAIENRDQVKFDLNVSHQGDYAVIASDSSIKVGVDTMKIEYSGGKSITEFFKRMTRQFSASEWTYIKEVSSEKEQLARFMRLWTLKEAYVKAEGFGITVDLQSVSFDCVTKHINPNTVAVDTRLTVDGQLLSNWVFEESRLDDQHCVSVALHDDSISSLGDHVGQQFSKLSYEELIQGAEPLSESILETDWTDYDSKQESPR